MPDRVSELYRTAFVTGATGGLGRAFVKMLLVEGVQVWGTSRDPARLTGFTAASAGARFTPVALDLAQPAAAEAIFGQSAEEAGGSFDLVIQNAGYGVFSEFTAADFATWQAQLDSLLVTTARLSHVALRRMRARPQGCLVHVSSLAAEFPLPFMTGYNVAKAGLSALSESLQFETRGTPLSVIDFRPGDYRTAFNQAMHTRTSAASPAASVPGAGDPRLASVWETLEANLQSGPPASRAAADLRRALLRRQRGVVRSGSFFQARLAPLLARLAPTSLVRTATARYFGL